MKDVDVADIADMVMQLLGLYHRADTVVGNDMVRGVSGGEKRRVSVSIISFSFFSFFFMIRF